MSAPQGRDERPAPIPLPDGLVLPGVLCAEVAEALEEYVLLLRGAPLAPGRRGAMLSRPVAALLLTARDAAARRQAQQNALRAAWAAPTAPEDKVLGSAQLPGVSDVEEITTTEAADLAGLSPERWRQLAVAGRIRGRQADRRTWWLQRQDVIAYVRSKESSRGHTDPHPARPEHAPV